MLLNQDLSANVFIDIGRASSKSDFKIHTTTKEKDIGVNIQANLNVSEQCGIAARKGDQLLGMIRRTQTETINYHKAIVRAHYEYCISACRGG